MAGSLYNADNVVVGDAVLWVVPWENPPIALVADDSVLFDNTDWEALTYVMAGATHEGFKINVDTSTTTIMIEEQSTPVAETVEGKSIAIEAALAEDTLETMQLAWGGGDITTVAAASMVTGTKKMSLVDDTQYYTVGLEMRNTFGLARRIYIPKVSATGSGDTAFRRAADKRTYPIRFASICAPSEIEIVDITGVALP
jgi:hypothetical protein